MTDQEESSTGRDLSYEPEDDRHLGWLATTKNKPLKLVRTGEHRMKGYLFPNRAAEIKSGDYCAVEKPDGTRIICIVEQIDSYGDNIKGETTSHKEEVFKITLNPRYELLPEGPAYPRPQTIEQGKITKLIDDEFYMMKRVPQFGMKIGQIEEGMNGEYQYYWDQYMLFQSAFIGGVQGTGKTTFLKELILLTNQEPNAPAVVIFDAEREYSNLIDIPSTPEFADRLLKLGARSMDPNDFEIIQIDAASDYCLTFMSIDPLHLPVFLHELQPVSFNLLQRIIQDIKNDNPDRQFTFQELRAEIMSCSLNTRYRLNHSVRDAISRALQSISLDLFDVPGKIPINVSEMLRGGKVSVIDVYDLRDDQQRIVVLYLLALLHQYNMKRSKKHSVDNPGSIFVLDEVQRILPQYLAQSAYQKRIIQFLSEIHHRGRKRKYGIIYATQSPADIKKIIVDLCNTKIFFQIQGSVEYLKHYLSKEQIEQLKRLPNGMAFIVCKGKHDPVLIKFPYIN